MGKKYTVTCPDGSTRVVFNNPDEAFPLVVKDWYTKWDVTAKFLNSLDASVRAEVGKVLSGRMYELDHSNKSMQISLRASYHVYIIDPCSKDVWFADRVKEIIEKDGMLREKTLEVEKLRVTGSDVAELAKQIKALKVTRTEAETDKELKDIFAKARDDIQSWMESDQA